MPTYDYQCQQCGYSFEVHATFDQKEAGLHPTCPRCSSQQVKQEFRTLAFVHSGHQDLRRAGPACSCAACGPDEC